jgi:hypothetical protein
MQDDPEKDPDGEAAQRPSSFLEFWFSWISEKDSSSLAPRGKVGNWFVVFHFPIRRKTERWECGNLARFARFPRDGGKRGKPAFGFPRFPRARHFHGSGAVEL